MLASPLATFQAHSAVLISWKKSTLVLLNHFSSDLVWPNMPLPFLDIVSLPKHRFWSTFSRHKSVYIFIRIINLYRESNTIKQSRKKTKCICWKPLKVSILFTGFPPLRARTDTTKHLWICNRHLFVAKMGPYLLYMLPHLQSHWKSSIYCITYEWS